LHQYEVCDNINLKEVRGIAMSEENKRKQRIIDAAIEVLKENPIEATTVRKIAAKAGLTTGAIYHHYKNKDELLLDVIKESLHFTHKLSETIKNEKNPRHGKELLDEIVNQVAIRLSKVDEQKLHIQLLSDMISRKSAVKKKYQKNYTDIIENTANLFDQSFEIYNEEYKRAVAAILVAAMDGIAMQQALGVLPENLEKMTETFTSFFVESIPAYLRSHRK
jgi:AcrR family transcriptional regulator